MNFDFSYLDIAFKNGSVITVNESDEIAQAVGVKGNKIVFVGTNEEIDQLIDEKTGEPFTAHTTNPVPFLLVNYDPAYTLRDGGCLADIVPTMIEMMGMEQPKEMTGKSLLVRR